MTITKMVRVTTLVYLSDDETKRIETGSTEVTVKEMAVSHFSIFQIPTGTSEELAKDSPVIRSPSTVVLAEVKR